MDANRLAGDACESFAISTMVDSFSRPTEILTVCIYLIAVASSVACTSKLTAHTAACQVTESLRSTFHVA